MFKMPEPFLLFDTQRQTVHFLIPTRIDVPMTVAIEPMKLYTEAQYKQGQRDALEAAINCYSPDDSATDWADKIRKLMEGL